MSEKQFNNIPPILPERSTHGLLNNVDYAFDEKTALVLWRKMIPPEHLYPNKFAFEAKKQPVPTSIEGLSDDDLTISLQGIKYLAWLRGYSSINFELAATKSDYAAAICRVSWLPNFETENREIVTSDGGDAHPFNTIGIGASYLTAMACNRAFTRCVRNFLRIPILGETEAGAQNVSDNVVQSSEGLPASDPHTLLESVLNAKNKTFAQLKKKMVKDGIEEAKEYKSLADIPKIMVFDLIDRLKNDKKLKD